MKRSIMLVLLALSPACIQTESPIKLGPTFALSVGSSTCSLQNSAVAQTGGILDISATTEYVIAFGLGSDLQQPTLQNANGTEAGSLTDNDFVFDQVQLNYVATPKLSLAQEILPTSGVVPAQAISPTSWIGMNVIGPKAAAALLAATAATNVELVVTATLQGNLRNGTPENSTPFAYPINVFNSGFAGCPAGVRAIPSGPCGIAGGQDGTAIGCCVPNPDGGALPTGC